MTDHVLDVQPCRTRTAPPSPSEEAVLTTPRTRPPFDPELRAALASLPPAILTSLTPETIPQVRAWAATRRSDDETLSRGGTVHVEELVVPGPPGEPDVALLVLRPASGHGPWPGVFHVHGGGMVMGDRRLGAEILAEWVEELGVVAVSVEYRLAPEHPHPAPVEDCYAGLVWTAGHAAEIGVDPARLVVAGSSAGGGLAAALALMARDRHGPALAGQLLVGPMLDDRSLTPSSFELDGDSVWDRTTNLTAWRALLGDAVGGPDVSPYAAPARATDLVGLPPAYVDVGSVETFRDEDLDYAARLSRAGVSVELHLWPGAFHGFETLAPDAALSRTARRTRLEALARLVGQDVAARSGARA
jgi:acetyl esterase/lipase